MPGAAGCSRVVRSLPWTSPRAAGCAPTDRRPSSPAPRRTAARRPAVRAGRGRGRPGPRSTRQELAANALLAREERRCLASRQRLLEGDNLRGMPRRASSSVRRTPARTPAHGSSSSEMGASLPFAINAPASQRDRYAYARDRSHPPRSAPRGRGRTRCGGCTDANTEPSEPWHVLEREELRVLDAVPQLERPPHTSCVASNASSVAVRHGRRSRAPRRESRRARRVERFPPTRRRS